ncbi:MAG: hypothetical protein IPK19_27020 [Chloroflexi bacterium]|nr:hypothetical protein [Chloroflexota bacterium]
MPIYLTPGIYIEEVMGEEVRPAQVWQGDCAGQPPSGAEITAMGTAAFIGITEKTGTADPLVGVGTPVLVESWGRICRSVRREHRFWLPPTRCVVSSPTAGLPASS